MKSGVRALATRVISQGWLWKLGVVIWAIVLFALSSRSTLPPGPQIPYQDKVVHFLYFSGGAFCFVLALYHRRWPMPSKLHWWLTGTAFGMVIGALDEYHQTYTPGRSGNDVGDWLADLSGAGAGALLAWWLFSQVRRLSTKSEPL